MLPLMQPRLTSSLPVCKPADDHATHGLPLMSKSHRGRRLPQHGHDNCTGHWERTLFLSKKERDSNDFLVTPCGRIKLSRMSWAQCAAGALCRRMLRHDLAVSQQLAETTCPPSSTSALLMKPNATSSAPIPLNDDDTWMLEHIHVFWRRPHRRASVIMRCAQPKRTARATESEVVAVWSLSMRVSWSSEETSLAGNDTDGAFDGTFFATVELALVRSASMHASWNPEELVCASDGDSPCALAASNNKLSLT